MFKRAQRAVAESDFVASNLFEEQAPPQDHRRPSFRDSAMDLRDGAEVTEFDTVPAELLDLFK